MIYAEVHAIPYTPQFALWALSFQKKGDQGS